MSDGGRPTLRASSLWTNGLWAALAAAGMVGWIAWGNRMEDTAPGRAPYDSLHTANDAETAALTRLLEQAHAVLVSDDFRRNLLALEGRYPGVYARPSEQGATIARIADIVGLKPFGARFAPTQVAVVDGGGPILAAAGEGAVAGRYADMLIGRPVLAAFAHPDVVARSCAVNVAAHEYAHTIVLTPMGYGMAFTDTRAGDRGIANRRDPDSPVASYLIGAVAQCTWLQRQGRIGRSGVPACVEVFGVRAFNWDRCPQFPGDTPVAPRAGLAPAAPAL
ncbi:hypothetical protein [Phenylobacterium sp.]|uniref:hypothetical protein n=1 Tax=Phenylobacterium sp. TaxID=1871053 RepID=UPI00301C484E